MRLARLALLALCLAPLPLLAEDPPAVEPVPLRDAVARGLVTAHGKQPKSYTGVTLVLRSRAEHPLVVELTGSYLKPRGNCQRLGLGPVLTRTPADPSAPGRVLVALGAGETRNLEVRTVCLDGGLPAPDRQEFEAATDPLPEVRETVMRWWADHPDAPQGAVNAAIWQNRPTVILLPGVHEAYREPKGLSGALHGGTVYRLLDGELTSRDPDGVTRFLGTRLFGVYPAAGALYSVSLGEDRKPELWRFALTGEEPWSRVAGLAAEAGLTQVLPFGRDRLLLVGEQDVRLLDTTTGQAVTVAGGDGRWKVSARLAEDGSLTAVMTVAASDGYWQGGERKGEAGDKIEVWSLRPGASAGKMEKRYWNVRDAAAGPAGVFALSHRGALRRLVGDDFRDLLDGHFFARILGVGRERVWLAGLDGRLAAAHPKTGAPEKAPDLAAGELRASVDPVTDDLLLTDGATLRRVRAADGAVEEVN